MCAGPRSAGLAVQGVTVVARAELLHLEPVGVVPTVLLGDVVPLLALRARERDLGADVPALAGHGLATSRTRMRMPAISSLRAGRRAVVSPGGSGSGTRPRDTTIMSRVLYPPELPRHVDAPDGHAARSRHILRTHHRA